MHVYQFVDSFVAAAGYAQDDMKGAIARRGSYLVAEQWPRIAFAPGPYGVKELKKQMKQYKAACQKAVSEQIYNEMMASRQDNGYMQVVGAPDVKTFMLDPVTTFILLSIISAIISCIVKEIWNWYWHDPATAQQTLFAMSF